MADEKYTPEKIKELRERWTPDRVDNIVKALRVGEDWTQYLEGTRCSWPGNER